jgi:hypothetical protein
MPADIRWIRSYPLQGTGSTVRLYQMDGEIIAIAVRPDPEPTAA